MRLERLSSPEDVAGRVVDLVARTVGVRPDARVVLPAGATPVPAYAEIVRRCRGSELDLSAAHLFQLDELVGVAPEDQRSFHAFLRTKLLDHLDRSPDRDHLLDGASAAPADEIARHADGLAALGGADLVLLGLGRNGHIAYNEPGSSAEDGARVVELHEETVRMLEPSFGGEEVPRRGLTLGLQEILAGRELVLIVTGASKASVLRRLLGATADPSFPASMITSHRSLTIIADEPASE